MCQKTAAKNKLSPGSQFIFHLYRFNLRTAGRWAVITIYRRIGYQQDTVAKLAEEGRRGKV